MIYELNNAVLDASQQPLSLMATEGQLTCLTGGEPALLTRWLMAMMGFEPIADGFICIDGEPLSADNATAFRQLMAYAPARLEAVGELQPQEAPDPETIFHLRRNRNQPITDAVLAAELRRIGNQDSDSRVQLLAVAALLGTPIIVADQPPATTAAYLRLLADSGRLLLVATNDEAILAEAHQTISIC
jgi:ABC-type siderophore export system fused ATPase/permease subunit